MVKINRVYTKSGDDGTTSLVGGDRVSKAAARIECYGTVDELNAVLGMVGMALSESVARERLLPIITRLQNELFNLGAELATPDPERRARSPIIETRHVDALEREIDSLNDELPELESFVLPGGGEVGARFHLARTVCRRAERLAVALAADEDISEPAIVFLNRLSDALFVFGRWAAMKEGESELLWVPEET